MEMRTTYTNTFKTTALLAPRIFKPVTSPECWLLIFILFIQLRYINQSITSWTQVVLNWQLIGLCLLFRSATLTLEVGSLGRSYNLVLMTSKWYIPVKNTLGRSAAVSCEGQLILLWETKFSVVLNLVRALHKFDSRPVTNWTANKWRPMKSVRDMFLKGCVCFLCRFRRETLSRPKHYSWVTISISNLHTTVV